MNIRPDLCCAAAYAALFAAAVWQSRRIGWLLAAVFCWLAAGFAGMWLLPRMLAPFSTVMLYAPQLYIVPACLLFLAANARRTDEASYYTVGNRALPVRFAAAAVAMGLGHALVTGLVWLRYPEGMTPRALPFLADLILLQPVYWLGMQLLLMALFSLHNRIAARAPSVFGIRQIQGGMLVVMLAQAVYAVSMMRWR